MCCLVSDCLVEEGTFVSQSKIPLSGALQIKLLLYFRLFFQSLWIPWRCFALVTRGVCALPEAEKKQVTDFRRLGLQKPLQQFRYSLSLFCLGFADAMLVRLAPGLRMSNINSHTLIFCLVVSWCIHRGDAPLCCALILVSVKVQICKFRSTVSFSQKLL